jgi:uncharacterized protein (DUF2225 family)
VDIEQTIGFIMEQQARSTEQQARFAEQLADQQKHFEDRLAAQATLFAEQLAAQHAEFAEQMAAMRTHFAEEDERLAQQLARIGDILINVSNTQERTKETLAILAERQIATEQSIRELSDKSKKTDDRLNALISIVERHIAGHE